MFLCCLAWFPVVYHPLFQPNSFQSLIIMSSPPRASHSPSYVYCSSCVTMTQLINILLVHITLQLAFFSLSLSYPHQFACSLQAISLDRLSATHHLLHEMIKQPQTCFMQSLYYTLLDLLLFKYSGRKQWRLVGV